MNVINILVKTEKCLKSQCESSKECDLATRIRMNMVNILVKTEEYLKSQWELSEEWGLTIRSRRYPYIRQRIAFWYLIRENFPSISMGDICAYIYPSDDHSRTMGYYLQGRVKEIDTNDPLLAESIKKINESFKEEIKSWE